MDARLKVAISAGILIILIIGFWFTSKTITAVTGKSILGWIISENPKDINGFMQCLSDKNVKMYGSYLCSHCQNEKKLFNDSIFFMKNIYVECDYSGENAQPFLCNEKQIEGYPTWEVNDKLYPGEKSLKQISSISGCKLN